MAASLPYLASPGTVKTALERVRAAATLDRVIRHDGFRFICHHVPCVSLRLSTPRHRPACHHVDI